MTQQLTNHVAMVVDASSSMLGLTSATIKAFDGLIASLKRQSETFNQETRVSVYIFQGGGNYGADIPIKISVPAFDMDVMRLPSLRSMYSAMGGTPLALATKQAIDDLKKVPALYTDHAFLVYVFTDGEENTSGAATVAALRNDLGHLPENWTVVAQVPNHTGVRYMQNLGFPKGNIEIWDTTERGLEIATQSFDRSINAYMANRTKGIRGSSSYFQMDATKLNAAEVKSSLSPLSQRKYKLVQNPHATAVQIKPLVEASTGEPYTLGNSFYALVKNETIQPQKKVLVREKSTGKVFGPEGARGLVGLPDVGSVLARPTLSPEYDLFIQSTSVNRNIIPKQSVLVLK